MRVEYYARIEGDMRVGSYGRHDATRISAGRIKVYKGQNGYFFTDAAWIYQVGGCDRQRFKFGSGTDLGGNVFTTKQMWLEYARQSADSLKTETQLGHHFPAAEV